MLKIVNPHIPGLPEEADISLVLKKKADASVLSALQKKPGGLAELETELSQFQEETEAIGNFRSRHQQFFVVGIGGSSLGVQVLAEIFHKKNFQFIDNVDAAHFEQVTANAGDLSQVGWIFISKSGRTIETLAALDLIQQIATEQSVSLKDHAVVITEKKDSDLYNWAVSSGVLFFEVPLTVGGRFSVLSSVGLVPALLMGLDVKKIRSGALKAFEDRESLTALTEATLLSFHRQQWITVLWSYSSRLRCFGLWWQQLWAESLAKRVNQQGAPAPRASTPLPLVGATDQHSVLQQIMEGARDKMVFFLRVGDAEQGKMIFKKPALKETQLLGGRTMGALMKAEAEATQQALSEVGVPNISLQVSDLGEENVGRLIMFFQLLVIALGESLNINTFDQPGVELGKIKAKKILSEVSN